MQKMLLVSVAGFLGYDVLVKNLLLKVLLPPQFQLLVF
ncbi:hypothetical protein THERMOS_2326 [Bathymodiolus thermophilus thioautotrophic gill symbiont]|uniref:Uncharacterized protein n=1 Tax=Bathymodiolus thermophilus thioautotrophic gill symbiont TaxID=2360 RepID=A0A8H8XFT2_9GAMM|nr:hypothetical protein THERMOS_2326 [Bathymodiolus thermophilus thioautotrophic gill symbiont]